MPMQRMSSARLGDSPAPTPPPYHICRADRRNDSASSPFAPPQTRARRARPCAAGGPRHHAAEGGAQPPPPPPLPPPPLLPQLLLSGAPPLSARARDMNSRSNTARQAQLGERRQSNAGQLELESSAGRAQLSTAKPAFRSAGLERARMRARAAACDEIARFRRTKSPGFVSRGRRGRMPPLAGFLYHQRVEEGTTLSHYQ